MTEHLPPQSREAEHWLPCPDFEAFYEVSDQGRVKRIAPAMGARVGRILRAGLTTSGYRMVILSIPTGQKAGAVHRLVARAFHGEPIGPASNVNHIDGNKQNNFAVNLEWVTHSENSKHAYRLGLSELPTRTKPFRSGAEHPNAKLTSEQVFMIRAVLQTRGVTSALAREYRVSPATISGIRLGESWRHLIDESVG